MLRSRNLFLHAGPNAKRFQSGFCVLAGRDAVGVCHGKLARAQRWRKGKAGRDGQSRVVVCRRNQDQTVADKINPARRRKQFARFQIIHPVDIGRDENVGGRARFDLLGERIASCVDDCELIA